ncbi:sulfur carrier protein ThiS [Aquimarina brevivitae]|uniref:Sulfur carrier protein ThiS n=1 Tax=Aquimarina brevivitae TaxID=323412 RepID=A0A4Q7PKV8_9FLAO|nr:sulfur carrier protein ThiS [Aquimarina brevivitae]RZS99602.1 sulfur carrier protein ThiS [Aquimarina brevivitae]
MIINLNSNPITISSVTSLQQILEEYKISSKGIAVAINHQIVSRDQWSDVVFNEYDQVTIIKATQGG